MFANEYKKRLAGGPAFDKKLFYLSCLSWISASNKITWISTKIILNLFWVAAHPKLSLKAAVHLSIHFFDRGAPKYTFFDHGTPKHYNSLNPKSPFWLNFHL